MAIEEDLFSVTLVGYEGEDNSNENADEEEKKDKGDDTDDEEESEEPKDNELGDDDSSDDLEEDIEEDYDEDQKVASAIFNTMVKLEYFEEDKDFKPSFDNLEEKFKNLPNLVADAIIQNQSPVVQNLLAYSFEKGKSVSRKELRALLEIEEMNDSIPSDEDLEDANTAREFLKRDFSKRNPDADEDEIDTYLNKLEEKDKLQERAKIYASKERESIDKQVKQKLEEEKVRNMESKKQQDEMFKNISSELDKTTWNNNVKSGVIENLKPEVLQRKNAMIGKSPKAIIQLANIYRLFDEKTGEFDFSSIEKQGESKAHKKTKDNIIRDSYNSSGSKSSKGSNKQPKSSFAESGLKLSLD